MNKQNTGWEKMLATHTPQSTGVSHASGAAENQRATETDVQTVGPGRERSETRRR